MFKPPVKYGYYPCSKPMYIWLLPMFKTHVYMVITHVQNSCIYGYYPCSKLMYIWLLPMFKTHVYMVITHVQNSCIYGYYPCSKLMYIWLLPMFKTHTHMVIPMFKPQDGWMICDFMSFSTVFQSYQDNGRMIMKGCVQ